MRVEVQIEEVQERMAEVLKSYSRMHYPSDDMLNALDNEETPTTDAQVQGTPEALTMMMRSMAKLNGSSSVTSLTSMSTASPRSSPRASQSDLFTMGAVFDSFENGIAMNTGTKSVENLTAMEDVGNRIMRTSNNNVALDVMRRFILAVERFLDVDGDGTHLLVC